MYINHIIYDILISLLLDTLLLLLPGKPLMNKKNYTVCLSFILFLTHTNFAAQQNDVQIRLQELHIESDWVTIEILLDSPRNTRPRKLSISYSDRCDVDREPSTTHQKNSSPLVDDDTQITVLLGSHDSDSDSDSDNEPLADPNVFNNPPKKRSNPCSMVSSVFSSFFSYGK